MINFLYKFHLGNPVNDGNWAIRALAIEVSLCYGKQTWCECIWAFQRQDQKHLYSQIWVTISCIWLWKACDQHCLWVFAGYLYHYALFSHYKGEIEKNIHQTTWNACFEKDHKLIQIKKCKQNPCKVSNELICIFLYLYSTWVICKWVVLIEWCFKRKWQDK